MLRAMVYDPQPEDSETFPWDRADFLGGKPWLGDYGFFERRGKGRQRRLVPVACDREELLARCSDLQAPAVNFVWTAESPYVQNIRDVGFLAEAFLARRRREAKSGLKRALIHVVLWPGLLWQSSRAEDFEPGDLEMGMFCMALIFGVIPSIRGVLTLLTARRWDAARVRESGRTTRFQEWINRDRAPTTWALCIVMLVIGGMQWATAPLLDASIRDAGLVKQAVRDGEYWRLLTGTLLHGGWTHLLVNTVALFALGRLTERLAGEKLLALVLLASAVVGSVCSQVLLPDVASVGFSGAILGLLGFLAAIGRRRLGIMPTGFHRLLTFDVAFILALGAVLHRLVDNGAHVGGIVTGWLLGLLLVRGPVGGIPLRPGRAVAALGRVSYRVLLAFAGLALWKIC